MAVVLVSALANGNPVPHGLDREIFNCVPAGLRCHLLSSVDALGYACEFVRRLGRVGDDIV